MRILTAITGLAVAGLIAGSATAASAGTTPSPSGTPTVAPNFGYHPKPVVRPWQFDLQQSDIGAILPTIVNRVEGAGAIPMDNWRDLQLTPSIDKFFRGPNSVTVLHDALNRANVTVNLNTCTVTFDQPYGRFRILAGTGTGANLRSRNGQFDLQGMISVSRISRYGRVSVCPLAFLSVPRIVRAVEYNASLGGPVTFADFSVQGFANVVSVLPAPKPYVTPTATATA